MADLVLDGYELVEYSRDSEPYLGNDGLIIHGGDHLHDPCLQYTGHRFTLLGGSSARGFLVVNDCQVVQCTKWTTEDGHSGGSTIVHNIVAAKGYGGERWRVGEEGKCSCEDGSSSSSCYVGKFIHMNDYNDDCAVGGSPGSIPCDNDTNVLTTFEIDRESLEETGISLLAVAGAVLLAALLLFCFCCRKKKRGTKQANNNHKALPVVAMAMDKGSGKQSKEKRRGWFGGKAKERAAAAPVVAAKNKAPAQQEVKESKRGWFGGRKKDANANNTNTSDTLDEEKAQAHGHNSATTDDSSIGPNKKAVFGGGKTSADEFEDDSVEVVSVTEKRRGWFGGKKERSAPLVQEPEVEKEESSLGNVNDAQAQRGAKNGKKDTKKKAAEPVHSGGAADQPTTNNKNEAVVKQEDQGVDCTCCGY